jgi:hypothetical protein
VNNKIVKGGWYTHPRYKCCFGLPAKCCATFKEGNPRQLWFQVSNYGAAKGDDFKWKAEHEFVRVPIAEVRKIYGDKSLK